METYRKNLDARGYSVSHRSRVKSVASGFAGWLIEEKGLLRKYPTRGVEAPAQALLAPRRLSPDQRYALAGDSMIPSSCATMALPCSPGVC